MKSLYLVAAGMLLSLSMPARAQSTDVKPAEKPPQKVDSGTIYGYRIHYVEPEYPLLARQAKIQGDVVLNAIIDKTGKITRIRVLNGHPVLAVSAMEAVRQWRYRPFLFKGEPVPVDTTITVKFHL